MALFQVRREATREDEISGRRESEMKPSSRLLFRCLISARRLGDWRLERLELLYVNQQY